MYKACHVNMLDDRLDARGRARRAGFRLYMGKRHETAVTRKQSAKQIKKKKKKKAEFVAQPNGPFCRRKVPRYHENVDLEAIRKHTKLYRIDCSTYRAFCIYLIVWTALFDNRSLPWRFVAEASLANHERFPGRDVFKKRAFKWSNLIRKVRD